MSPSTSMRVLPMLTLLLGLPNAFTSETADEHPDDDLIILESEDEEIEPAYAVLFPPFALTVGIIVFFVLTRFAKALPYTAVMFLLGTVMGIAAAVGNFSDHINQSIRLWIPINSEMLLLVFLPGLLFKDAFGQNVHLFAYSFAQLLVFAFPMVLMGTVLTAVVGYYIFPFGWSFNLAMTFGSILAATDPVAVAALLEEVGAPPRLKVHVAGESLLNDGSAIVFFSIFSERYFYELGFPGFGEDVDLAKGIALFCRKALGGVAVGLFFGTGLLGTLFILDRRFSREENVVQVTAVLAVAYLNYYVSDFVWRTSGVIATVTAGLLVKLLGRAMVNDPKLLDDSLTLVEHLLNTLLFTLGGVVWGAVIADGEKIGVWQAREWGYLILLYVLLQVIRALQFSIAFPITVRIGLKTNWRETIFQMYGGLRGAVGIALAIALDNEVSHVTGGQNETIDEEHTQQVFAMVGGIAFMTLVINGTTAGPLLRKLGLADSTETRKKIVSAYQVRARAVAIDDMVKLLTQKRFRLVNFALVKHHVPYLADLTKVQLRYAVNKHKDTSPTDLYNPPYLDRILPYLEDGDTPFSEALHISTEAGEAGETNAARSAHAEHARKARIEMRTKNRKKKAMRFSTNNMRFMLENEPLSAQELRILFIAILRNAYDEQIADGELDDQHLLAVSLDQSLEFAADAVSRGEPLKDWEYLTLVHKPISGLVKRFKDNTTAMGCLKLTCSRRAPLGLKTRAESMFIERSIAFMAAHRSADAFFISEFQDVDSELNEAGKVVLAESQKQYRLAEEALNEFDQKTVELNVSHKFCKILLTMGISNMAKLVKVGMIKESEAEPFIEEIEEFLGEVISCEEHHHPGEKEILNEEEARLEKVQESDDDDAPAADWGGENGIKDNEEKVNEELEVSLEKAPDPAGEGAKSLDRPPLKDADNEIKPNGEKQVVNA